MAASAIPRPNRQTMAAPKDCTKPVAKAKSPKRKLKIGMILPGPSAKERRKLRNHQANHLGEYSQILTRSMQGISNATYGA